MKQNNIYIIVIVFNGTYSPPNIGKIKTSEDG